MLSKMNEPPDPPPIKYPPWVKKEILLPIFGVLAIGLMGGSYLVYRSIKKEERYSPTEYGPMDHRPLPVVHPAQAITDTNAPTETNQPPASR